MLDMTYSPGFDTERTVEAMLSPFEKRGIPVKVF